MEGVKEDLVRGEMGEGHGRLAAEESRMSFEMNGLSWEEFSFVFMWKIE